MTLQFQRSSISDTYSCGFIVEAYEERHITVSLIVIGALNKSTSYKLTKYFLSCTFA